MAQLYITDNKVNIGIDGGRLKIKHADGLIRTIPLESVEGITIIGNAQVTTYCIGECLRRGIAVQYYSGKGFYFGKVSSTQHVNTKRQRAQIKLTEDEEFSLTLARNVMKAKINNQIVLLRRFQRHNENKVDKEIQTMKRLEAKIDNAKALPELLGYEGNAARVYFKGLNHLTISSEFKFNGRNRRPPKDAFNSMLSLGYTIMMNDLFGAIEGRGLSPYFGFIHQDSENHPTLSSDLIEEWRAVIVDSLVMSLINGNEISIDNFYRDEETRGVYFDKAGLKIFLKKLEKKLETSIKYLEYTNYELTFRKAIDMQVLQLCKAIETKDPLLYKPIFIR